MTMPSLSWWRFRRSFCFILWWTILATHTDFIGASNSRGIKHHETNQREPGSKALHEDSAANNPPPFGGLTEEEVLIMAHGQVPEPMEQIPATDNSNYLPNVALVAGTGLTGLASVAGGFEDIFLYSTSTETSSSIKIATHDKSSPTSSPVDAGGSISINNASSWWRATTHNRVECGHFTKVGKKLQWTIDVTGNFRFWTEGILSISVASFGLFGNILSMWVLSAQEMRGSSAVFNRLLLALSIIDCLFILPGALIYSSKAFSWQPDWYNRIFPIFLYPFSEMALCSSIYMTVAIAIERYIGLCRPLQRLQGRPFSAKAYLIPVLIIAILLNIPKFFESKTIFRTDPVTNELRTRITVTDLRLHPDYITYYWMWTRLIATGVVPLTALAVLNTKIYISIRQSKQRLRALAIRSALPLAANINILPVAASVSVKCNSLAASPVMDARNEILCGNPTPRGSSAHNISVSSHNGGGKHGQEEEDLDEDTIPECNGKLAKTQAASEGESPKGCAATPCGLLRRKGNQAEPLGSNRIRLKKRWSPLLLPSSGLQRNLSSAERSEYHTPNSALLNGLSGAELTLAKALNGVANRNTTRQLNHNNNCGSVPVTAGHHSLHSSSTGNSHNGENNLAPILFGVVIVFVICNSMRVALNIYDFWTLESIIDCEQKGVGRLPPAWIFCCISVSHLLLMVNSSINFLVYCMAGTRFRHVLQRKCSRVRKSLGSSLVWRSVVRTHSRLVGSGHQSGGTKSVIAATMVTQLRIHKELEQVHKDKASRPSVEAVPAEAAPLSEGVNESRIHEEVFRNNRGDREVVAIVSCGPERWEGEGSPEDLCSHALPDHIQPLLKQYSSAVLSSGSSTGGSAIKRSNIEGSECQDQMNEVEYEQAPKNGAVYDQQRPESDPSNESNSNGNNSGGSSGSSSNRNSNTIDHPGYSNVSLAVGQKRIMIPKTKALVAGEDAIKDSRT